MNMNYLRSGRDSSSIESENDSQAFSNSSNGPALVQEAQNNEILQELQIKRDDRTTSEKFRDQELPDLHSNDFDNKGNESDSTHDDSQHIGSESLESIDEQPPLQLPAPTATANERNSLQVMSGSLMNVLHNVFEPIRQPSLPIAENAQPPRPRINPFLSFFTSLPMFRHNTNNLAAIGDSNSIQEDNDGEENVPNTDTEHHQINQSQPDAHPDPFDHGTLIIRTVHPGPNGLMIVRMRVLSLDEIFGRHEEGGPEGPENPDNLQAGLFGALFSLLMRTSDVPMQRGLPKEALDNLPLVTFDSEGFKNVEEGSKKCPICFDQYEDGQELRYLWCLHRFHKGCVDQWLDSHSNCPICKKDYSELEKENFE